MHLSGFTITMREHLQNMTLLRWFKQCYDDHYNNSKIIITIIYHTIDLWLFIKDNNNKDKLDIDIIISS